MMEIYLTSHESESELTSLVQQVLQKQQLQDDYTVEILPAPATENQRMIDFASIANVPTLVSALVVAVGAGGAITQLAKAVEALINRKVQVKIKHGKTVIELSGSAGHIQKALETILGSNK